MESDLKQIDIDQLAERRTGGTVLDVREPQEYASGRVPGAMHIPMGQLASRLHELDRDAPVFVVCASGNRSKSMAQLLAAQDFDAATVRGGTNAWIASGRPVERG